MNIMVTGANCGYGSLAIDYLQNFQNRLSFYQTYHLFLIELLLLF